MIKFINLTLLIIFVAIVLVFTAGNSQMISVHFLGLESIKLPVSVIVFSSIIIGIIITLIYHFYVVLKLKSEFKNKKTTNEPVEGINDKK